MLYFLVIIIPFSAYMAYLIYQNNQLKKDYLGIINGLRKTSKSLSLEYTALLDELQKNYIVTNSSIKRIENYITALEDLLKVDKQQVISNTFKPKAHKLTVLQKRLSKLEHKMENPQIAQPTMS